MRKVLFIKKSSRMSGGHIKFHDYFEHCLRHPELDPYVYLAFDRMSGGRTIWESDAERIVPHLDIEPYDLLFIDGRDWELLPREAERKTVLQLIQDFRHVDAGDPRYAFISRDALRICVSPELAAAVRRHVAGHVAAIPNGIPPELFTPGQTERGSVLVWARKDPPMGKALRSALSARGVTVTLLTRPVPRPEFAWLLGRTDLFVGLPKGADRGWEGFFLPALEAMASGCAVVCADAIGNRSFCVDGETCRTPGFGDLEDHIRLVEELLADGKQLDSLRARGVAVARGYTIEQERAQFHRFIEEYVLTMNVASTAS